MPAPMKFYQRHIRRYLRIGELGFSRLMDRAGLGNYKGQPWFSRAQAKRLMRYHFVMLYELNTEKKPVPKGKWFPPGTRDRSLRRSVHPRLQSLARSESSRP